MSIVAFPSIDTRLVVTFTIAYVCSLSGLASVISIPLCSYGLMDPSEPPECLSFLYSGALFQQNE
jgi:hypothetical protein